MSLPPINPSKTAAGIAVDPRTLERVVPESRRADGTVRKQLKIRPGFTPQEDVQRFRGTKQAQMDATALPKGHIIGWVAPSSAAAKPLSKSAKKNAKRKEKRAQGLAEGAKAEPVPDNWDDEEEVATTSSKAAEATAEESEAKPSSSTPTPTETIESKDSTKSLVDKLEKLNIES